MVKAILKNGVYHLLPKVPGSINRKVTVEALSLGKKENLSIWHRRMSHVNPSVIAHTCKENDVRGLPEIKNFDFTANHAKITNSSIYNLNQLIT